MFRGSCHCGAVSVEFGTKNDPATLVPRACDCTFCTRHAAMYVSDPLGTLSITAKRALQTFTQGSNNAQFLACGVCGVLVAVVYDQAGRMFGAVNVRCIDDASKFATSMPASPQQLSAAEKIARWTSLWIPDVSLTIAAG